MKGKNCTRCDDWGSLSYMRAGGGWCGGFPGCSVAGGEWEAGISVKEKTVGL